jgi:hypothetical protein
MACAPSGSTAYVVFCDVLMAALAMVGITGMYLREVTRAGVLGLIGYLLLSTGYLIIMSSSFIAAFILPLDR